MKLLLDREEAGALTQPNDPDRMAITNWTAVHFSALALRTPSSQNDFCDRRDASRLDSPGIKRQRTSLCSLGIAFLRFR
jgi:hypothetical protein